MSTIGSATSSGRSSLLPIILGVTGSAIGIGGALLATFKNDGSNFKKWAGWLLTFVGSVATISALNMTGENNAQTSTYRRGFTPDAEGPSRVNPLTIDEVIAASSTPTLESTPPPSNELDLVQFMQEFVRRDTRDSDAITNIRDGGPIRNPAFSDVLPLGTRKEVSDDILSAINNLKEIADFNSAPRHENAVQALTEIVSDLNVYPETRLYTAEALVNIGRTSNIFDYLNTPLDSTHDRWNAELRVREKLLLLLLSNPASLDEVTEHIISNPACLDVAQSIVSNSSNFDQCLMVSRILIRGGRKDFLVNELLSTETPVKRALSKISSMLPTRKSTASQHAENMLTKGSILKALVESGEITREELDRCNNHSQEYIRLQTPIEILKNCSERFDVRNSLAIEMILHLAENNDERLVPILLNRIMDFSRDAEERLYLLRSLYNFKNSPTVTDEMRSLVNNPRENKMVKLYAACLLDENRDIGVVIKTLIELRRIKENPRMADGSSVPDSDLDPTIQTFESNLAACLRDCTSKQKQATVKFLCLNKNPSSEVNESLSRLLYVRGGDEYVVNNARLLMDNGRADIVRERIHNIISGNSGEESLLNSLINLFPESERRAFVVESLNSSDGNIASEAAFTLISNLTNRDEVDVLLSSLYDNPGEGFTNDNLRIEVLCGMINGLSTANVNRGNQELYSNLISGLNRSNLSLLNEESNNRTSVTLGEAIRKIEADCFRESGAEAVIAALPPPNVSGVSSRNILRGAERYAALTKASHRLESSNGPLARRRFPKPS